MPTFFFDVQQNGRIVRDIDGMECDNERAAENEAMRAACDILRDAVGWGNQTLAVLVRDRNEKTIVSVEVNSKVSRNI